MSRKDTSNPAFIESILFSFMFYFLYFFLYFILLLPFLVPTLPSYESILDRNLKVMWPNPCISELRRLRLKHWTRHSGCYLFGL